MGLSTLLLVSAALLAGSFLRVLRADKGFRAPGVLAASIAIPSAKYKEPKRRTRFYEQVLGHLSEPPAGRPAIEAPLRAADDA